VPFYEYQCVECGKVQEAFQKMSDPPLDECKSCHGKVRRVFHPVAVHFKGSGFYATDNRKSEAWGAPDGYTALQREKERRAEEGDPLYQRVVDRESSSSPSKKSGSDEKPKEKQKTS
jgi:putative FmdB family regulatory protein